jgi:hypothetical protein
MMESNGKIYHANCFACFSCKKKFTSPQQVVVQDGKLLCDQCGKKVQEKPVSKPSSLPQSRPPPQSTNDEEDDEDDHDEAVVDNLSKLPSSPSSEKLVLKRPSFTRAQARRAPSKAALKNKSALETSNPLSASSTKLKQNTGQYGVGAESISSTNLKSVLERSNETDKSVQPEKAHKLIQVKGRRKVKVRQV